MALAKCLSRRVVILSSVLLLTSCASLAGIENASPSANASQVTIGGNTVNVHQTIQRANAGNPDAEYALGYMYYYGQGVARNRETALAWINKAAVQGQPQAVKALRILQANEPSQAGKVVTRRQQQSNNIGRETTTTRRYPIKSSQRAPTKTTTQHARKQPQQRPIIKAAAKPATQPAVKAAKSVEHATAHAIKTAARRMTTQERYLLGQSNNSYTLQLLGSYHKSDITRYSREHRLEGKAKVYRTYFHGKDWYVLTYGVYKSAESAHAAVKQLPRSIQHLKPWVKPMAEVKHGILQKAPRVS